VSLIEAQAAGKPVVSTDVGGVRDVMANNRSGFITKPNDADEFGAALLQLIEDEIMRQKFGDFGRMFVKSKFSYQRLVRDMADYYYRLLGQSKAWPDASQRAFSL